MSSVTLAFATLARRYSLEDDSIFCLRNKVGVFCKSGPISGNSSGDDFGWLGELFADLGWLAAAVIGFVAIILILVAVTWVYESVRKQLGIEPKRQNEKAQRPKGNFDARTGQQLAERTWSVTIVDLGNAPDEVLSSLRGFVSKTPEELQSLCSHLPVKIRSKLKKEAADRLVAAINDAGGRARAFNSK